MSKKFPELARKAMGDKGVKTQRQLAKLAKVSPTQLSMWLSGRVKPDMPSIEKLATALSVPVANLIEVSPQQPIEQPMDLTKDVYIEIKGKVWATPFRLSMGHGLGRFIKGRPGEQDCFALEVEGNSMAPIYLPGDLIICRPKKVTLSPYSETDEAAAYVPYEVMAQYNNRDAVVTYNGETNLKRIQVERKSGPKYEIWMMSMNPQYPRVRVNFGDEWEAQAFVLRKENPPLPE